MQVLKHWIKNSVEERLAEEAIKILSSSKEEVEKMVSSNAFILTEMEEEAKRKGREEGIKEGIKEGIEEGIEEGIREVAIKMIKKGKSIDEIMELTELPKNIVEDLIKKIK